MNDEKKGKVILYLMRHGQTIINKAGRVQGWCDGVLTPEGIEVAENVALGLKDIEFKAICSSDLGRAIQTARIVRKANRVSKNIEVKEVPELREIHFGKYEGEFEKLMVRDILNHLNLKSFEEAARIPNFGKLYVDTCSILDETGSAENYDTLIERIKKGVRTISQEVEAEGGGNVLLVIHGGMLRNLLHELDPDFKIDKIENSSISVVEYENGEFNIVSVNDMSYKVNGEKIKSMQS